MFEWDQKIECRCHNRKKVAKLKGQNKIQKYVKLKKVKRAYHYI